MFASEERRPGRGPDAVHMSLERDSSHEYTGKRLLRAI